MIWQIALIGLAVLAGIVGVVLYLWRRDIVNDTISHVESKSNKNALDDLKEVLGEQDKIREKYDRLRNTVPDDWNSAAKLRKEGRLPGQR